MLSKVDNQGMRRINRAIVLDLVRRGGRLSRTELARRSSMTKPTISAIVDDLIEEGLVREVGYSPASVGGGRKAVLLELDATSAVYLGVHFGVHRTTVAVSDARGEVRATAERRTPVRSPRRAIAAIPSLLDEALARAGLPRSRLQAAGVAVPGLVDRTDGLCVLAPNLGWRDVPLSDEVAALLNVPVVVNNITQAAALAEARLGAGRGVRSFVWVYIGSGIGSGIVVDGQLYYGAHGFSGEIGHCPVVDDGLRCGCGRRGCLETVASGKAITERAARELQWTADVKTPGTEEVVAAARAGDAGALRIFSDAGTYLGKGVSYLVNLLNPELVVLGGRVMEASDLLLSPVRAALARHALAPAAVQVVRSVLGPGIEARGAVFLAMNHVGVQPVLASSLV